MVGQFLSCVGELLSALLGIFDSVFAFFRGVTKW